MNLVLTVWVLFFVAIISYIVVNNKKRMNSGKGIDTSFNTFEKEEHSSRVTDPKFMYSSFNIYN